MDSPAQSPLDKKQSSASFEIEGEEVKYSQSRGRGTGQSLVSLSPMGDEEGRREDSCFPNSVFSQRETFTSTLHWESIRKDKSEGLVL